MIPAILMLRHEFFLTSVNFTLDQGANLIKLPSNSAQQGDMAQLCRQHRQIHNGRTAGHYENAVSNQLNRIERELNRGKITPQQASQKVQQVMKLLQSEIESGRYTNVNDVGLAQTIGRWQF